MDTKRAKKSVSDACKTAIQTCLETNSRVCCAYASGCRKTQCTSRFVGVLLGGFEIYICTLILAENAMKSLYTCVIVAVAFTAHTTDHMVFFQQFTVFIRRILRTPAWYAWFMASSVPRSCDCQAASLQFCGKQVKSAC